MKKRNTLLTVALLLTVVILGVGYAAASGPWVVEGTATAKASQLDVAFTAATNGTVSSDILAEMTAVELDEIGEFATAEFVIKNRSKAGIGAQINADDITVTYGDENATTSDYFTVTKALDKNYLASGDSATLTVTVTLEKVGLTDITESFKVSINDITAKAE